MTITFSENLSKGRIAYDRIAYLQNRVLNSEDDTVHVKIKGEGQLGRTFVFLLGCLYCPANENNKKFIIGLPEKHMKHFKGMDIYQYYKQPHAKFMRFYKIDNPSDIIELVNGIVAEAPVNFSENNEELLVSRIGEMYNNSLDHSKAENIIAGRYFKSTFGSTKRYCFVCYDSGTGIPENVRQYQKKSEFELSDEDAINWAFAKGTTTKPIPGVLRGLGFDLLHKFSEQNHGAIRICSGNVLYEYNSRERGVFKVLNNKFYGTLFEMDILSGPDVNLTD